MDLTIRDWMVIIGAGLILAVLIDAARRVYRERRSEVRLNAKITPAGADGSDSDFNLLSELPNGGARSIRRDDLMPPQRDDAPVTAAVGDTGLPSAAAPVLDNAATVAAVNAQALGALATAGELPADAHSRFAEAQWDDDESDDVETATVASSASASGDTAPSGGSKSDAKDELVAGFSSRDEQPETLDWLEQLEPDVAPEPEPDARLPRGIEPHVFVLNVVARAEAGFSGKDILHILLACDLRFGDMDFFHRHEQSAGRGPIQFSVSNMMKPGVFDIDAMSALQTKGLMFFVTLPGPEDMLKAFDYMYETAKAVARNLNGDVLDETRSAVTPQSLEHMRQQIRELERRILVQSER